MRALRLSLVGTVILTLFAGLGVGVAAQDEDETPTSTYVTGNYIDSFGTAPEFSELDGVERMRMTSERVVEWSDPRLPSKMATKLDLDSRLGVHPDGPVSSGVRAYTYRLEGPTGAWTGTGRGFSTGGFEFYPTEESWLFSTELVELTGEGDYEGLSAILVLNTSWGDFVTATYTFEGYIFEGEPPPLPEPIEPGFALE